MAAKWRASGVGLVLALAVVATGVFGADQGERARLMQAYQAGNFRDAYDGLRKLAFDPKDDPSKVGQDLETAVAALHRLGRSDETDDFREAVIKVHAKNWRLLETAAQNYANDPHYGYIVAGKFYRGNHRGGGQYVQTYQRDRARALQLMEQALKLTRTETDKAALGQFHLHFANMLVSSAGYYQPYSQAWRLQYLTDLSQLPDYGDDYSWYGNGRGAPVDADGKPIYYHVPKSYEAAKSDGERWRWMLSQAAEYDRSLLSEADIQLADFLHQQFGVQTMLVYGRFGGDDTQKDESGPYSVHTLSDRETIARLASGIKRFRLPGEFNYIKIYERIAGRGKSTWGERARDTLARIYEDRRQYLKAETAWKQDISEYGAGPNNWRQQQLDQIVKNWGRFDNVPEQPAGSKATVEFRYRNGNKVTFEAFTIDVSTLLDDVKAYLRSSPNMLDWNKVQIGNIGYRLVWENEQKYIGAKVASWEQDLKPRPAHVDERITVTTPLDKPGAYLLTAKMDDGNTSRIIIWLSDTAILKKNLDGRVYYFVADAITGKPVQDASVDYFGYRQIQVQPFKPIYRIETAAFTKTTDHDGQIILDDKAQSNQYTWLITAHKPKAGVGGADRLAYLGFTGVWYAQMYDQEYNQVHVYTITDRPVYRPEQTVHFKFWVRHAKYDQPDTSTFANQSFSVQIHNPRGDKILEKAYTADAYGGIAGDFHLPKDAVLGTYSLAIVNHGGGSFRVEEYKKPEFEVNVEAPKEPVRLGEQITAKIQAKYYFGAPVTHAKVKYKVLRTSYSNTWFPRGSWDWLYGRGYWWFAPDYAWFPGWADWGMKRPAPPWWGVREGPPEVVLENEVPIAPDGTVHLSIDTRPAKELHGNQDHRYSITAEVVDESRRTIVGTGEVLVARKPFRVFTWVDRGHYRTGDTVKASFRAQTLDQKPVEGRGKLTLFQVTYDAKGKPTEKAVQTWKLDTDAQGQAREQITAAQPGQYRLSYQLTDSKKHTIEGGYLFTVTGEGFDGRDFRFNDIELITDKREYAPGDKVKLLVNTNRCDGVVLLFLRPTNGVYLAPKVLRLEGKSVEQEVAVVKKDMPNFFIEAVTIADGRVHTDVREVIVPPEKRVLNVRVLPSQAEYLPGQKAKVKVKLTDFFGKPFVGSTVLTIYDKAVEYISGGSNVPEIRAAFWSWRRNHYPQTESSLGRWFTNLLKQGEIAMGNLGTFGEIAETRQSKRKDDMLSEFEGADKGGMPMAPMAQAAAPGMGGMGGGGGFGYTRGLAKGAAGLAMDRAERAGDKEQFRRGAVEKQPAAGEPPLPPGVEPTVRKNFADTALWVESLTTNKDGVAEVSLTMPENLTGWKVKVWAMGHGTKVGQGEAEVVTKKNLLLRLQAPRFFVQKDEVVLSANIHNYLKTPKLVRAILELGGNTLTLLAPREQRVEIPAGDERRVDWRVRVDAEGQAVVRMKAITDEESDAMEMRFPCHVHGMLKTDSYSGVVRPNKDAATVTFSVPAERRINETRLEVRYSPTLAGAMVDALPYLVEYPYGCTEQTLNRFLPTVITQKVLERMHLDLKAIEEKRTNLNAQEIGDARERAKGWKRYPRNPVFNESEVKAMSVAGVEALVGMQLSDGGWGWFSGWGEHSWPHTTALVVHGLQIARENGVAVGPVVIQRGVAWLTNYQQQELVKLHNAPSKTQPYKEFADNLDAMVYMVLNDAGVVSNDMMDFLYRDRTHLAVYAKAMYGLALYTQKQPDKLAMILKNIDQYLVQDDENQTAYLRLPASDSWWNWYGSETEANGYYLKLLARTSPKDEKAAGLVKYLLNNRKHATYWNSTRDTAICIEAMADYLKASGEDSQDMTVEVWLDGRKTKQVHIDAGNLFTFDNQMVLFGDAVDTGKHTLEIKRQGKGPVYFNAYLTNFTLEDFIKKAGLEVKVNRKYYKLTRVDKTIKVEGAHGQAADQKVEKYKRTELPSGAVLKSGDLVEVELEIDSKNDYEYVIFEDPKAAGFEATEVRSGYTANGLGAYMEVRDDRVCFFVRALARGKHSVSYRLRAEIPGKFSALPTRAYAMYAPELRGNSDEMKVSVED